MIKENTYNDTPDYSGGTFPDCPKCKTTMQYSYVGGEFKCPECGQLMDEDDWDIVFDYDDPDNPPPGCDGCGNPDWPNCKTSCNVFDD